MQLGSVPFYSTCPHKKRYRICNANVKFPCKKKYTVVYSDAFENIVKRLLTKDPIQRLGSKDGSSDYMEVLQDPFFDGIDKE